MCLTAPAIAVTSTEFTASNGSLQLGAIIHQPLPHPGVQRRLHPVSALRHRNTLASQGERLTRIQHLMGYSI